jgi:penicillin-insensitive murein endopeptidase
VCKQAPGEAWVGKLRPWVGHFSHFHVRLRCPANSPDCQSQAPIPPGNGCGRSWPPGSRTNPSCPRCR